MIDLVQGDLLEAHAEALVNAVNTVGIMGKGLALQFARAHSAMLADYQRACKAGEVQPGRMHIFVRPGSGLPRFLINFPTKRHWRSSSRIEDIAAGLDALVLDIQRLGIKSIAIPPLGCGHGGLDWNRVLPLIREKLQGLHQVRVLVYEPTQAAPGTLIHDVKS